MVLRDFLFGNRNVDILANMADGVLLVDLEGKIHQINPRMLKLFDAKKSQILKSNINELIDGGLELVKQAAMTKKSAVGLARGFSHEDFYAEVTAVYKDDLIIASLRDVTQNYRTVTNILNEHESSKKVNKDKNAFLVKLSSELKSPLQSIVGFSQAMIDGLGGDMSDKQEKYVKIINKNSNDLLSLIAKVVDLSRTESNLIEYDFQVFDCVNSITAALRNLETLIREKNLKISIEAEEGFKKAIFSDEESFRYVMQSLLEISLKSTDIGSINIALYNPTIDFAKSRGVNVFEGATEQSYLGIAITDTGSGYSQNELDNIFEPYAQLEKPSKKNIIKSIALSSAKNIVGYLEGAMWIESETMQGSCYNFIIPIEKPYEIARQEKQMELAEEGLKEQTFEPITKVDIPKIAKSDEDSIDKIESEIEIEVENKLEMDSSVENPEDASGSLEEMFNNAMTQASELQNEPALFNNQEIAKEDESKNAKPDKKKVAKKTTKKSDSKTDDKLKKTTKKGSIKKDSEKKAIKKSTAKKDTKAKKETKSSSKKTTTKKTTKVKKEAKDKE